MEVIILLMLIVLFLTLLAAIAAWLNTQTILRDLSEIKAKLGIKEEKRSSFFNKDLDND